VCARFGLKVMIDLLKTNNNKFTVLVLVSFVEQPPMLQCRAAAGLSTFIEIE
jgi:sarcosine oxidase gamma subunit